MHLQFVSAIGAIPAGNYSGPRHPDRERSPLLSSRPERSEVEGSAFVVFTPPMHESAIRRHKCVILSAAQSKDLWLYFYYSS
jgi:hypothetical protein